MACPQPSVLVDSRAAWRAALAGFISQFVQVGFARSCSLLLLSLSDDYEVPKAILLPTIVLNVGLDKLLAPLAERFSAMFGARVAVTFSTVVTVCALTAVFVVPITSASVIVLLGVCLGFGSTFATLPMYHVVMVAFKKRRGVAMSFVKAGVSLGSFSLPPLFVLLAEVFGSRGAFLLTAGIFMHIFVAALLLPASVIDGATQRAVLRPPRIRRIIRRRRSSAHVVTDEAPNIARVPLITRLPLLMFYAGVVMVSMTFFMQMVNVYPLYAAEMGLSRWTIAATLSFQSVVDFFGRMGSGLLTDRLTNVGRLRIFGFTHICGGASALLLGWFNCATPMAFIFNFFFGIAIAQMAACWIPILVGFTDVTYLPRAMSLTFLGVGINAVGSVFVLKFVVSLFDSHHALVYFYGCGFCVCGLLLTSISILFPWCIATKSPDEFNEVEMMFNASSNHQSDDNDSVHERDNLN